MLRAGCLAVPCRACVILSGGLDSSIVACLGQEALGLAAAITVLASPDATDRPHATAMAAAAGLAAHHQLEISLEEALQELPDAVRVLQSFDPMALRNEIAGTGRGGWGLGRPGAGGQQGCPAQPR